MKIKINDHGITAKLKKIRRGMGARIDEKFVPVRADYRPIEITIDDDSMARVASDPSGLLVSNGRVVFAYIKDHTITFPWSWRGRGNRQSGPADPLDPANLRKLHFTPCRTLKQKIKEGKYESRYVVTNRTDNKYYITIGAGGFRSGEREVALFPCQNCLNAIKYKDFSFSSSNKEKNDEIVKSFDAKAAKEELQHFFRKFQEETAGLPRDTVPRDYPHDWSKKSAAHRKEKNYVCEECGVQGTARTTHTHHKDSNKSNIRKDNLQCLCEVCHSKKHPHMRANPRPRPPPARPQ